MKERLETAVHTVARRMIALEVKRYEENSNPYTGGGRERLSALHTLAGLTGPLETLCHRFGLKPLTEVWNEN